MNLKVTLPIPLPPDRPHRDSSSVHPGLRALQGLFQPTLTQRLWAKTWARILPLRNFQNRGCHRIFFLLFGPDPLLSQDDSSCSVLHGNLRIDPGAPREAQGRLGQSSHIGCFSRQMTISCWALRPGNILANAATYIAFSLPFILSLSSPSATSPSNSHQ